MGSSAAYEESVVKLKRFRFIGVGVWSSYRFTCVVESGRFKHVSLGPPIPSDLIMRESKRWLICSWFQSTSFFGVISVNLMYLLIHLIGETEGSPRCLSYIDLEAKTVKSTAFDVFSDDNASPRRSFWIATSCQQKPVRYFYSRRNFAENMPIFVVSTVCGDDQIRSLCRTGNSKDSHILLNLRVHVIATSPRSLRPKYIYFFMSVN